jgi:flagellar biogenesis protein FliO
VSPEATYVLQSLATVALFGGALWVALRGLRRVGASPRNGPLEILARQPLDGRRAIYLVRVGKRVLVVGATDGSLTRLASTSLESLELDTKTPEPPRGRFAEVLGRVLGPRGPRP